jgi:hypothetical protein
MALVAHVALVSESAKVSRTALDRAAAAIAKQVTRDLGPLWSVRATVSGFASVAEVPVGYWPVIVQDDVGAGALGYHLDRNGQPYALVRSGRGWELTASHETLEMLADPFGSRTVAGPSVKPGQGRVQYLVEVCDPCEAETYAYTVNGVTVSDFYTPHFFDPKANVATRYSFTGAIKAPRTILRGGYMSWLEPKSGHLWQQLWLGARKEFRDLGPADAPLRGQVDADTKALAIRAAATRARATRRSRRS